MVLDTKFVRLARMVGVSYCTPASEKTSYALSKMTNIPLSDARFLMQVVTVCGQKRAYFDVLQPSLLRLVAARPSLMAFYTVAQATAANATSND